MSLKEQRRIGFPSSLVTSYGQRTKRASVIALFARNDVPTTKLALFHPVLACQLERGFHGLRATA
ncbi:hypothetical protein D3C84_1284440 [compost metagenome]